MDAQPPVVIWRKRPHRLGERVPWERVEVEPEPDTDGA